ncbi:hypothetical protein ACF1A5_26200 [Streptomyces sp. NPDC014864]|uniref:hypothetical protein n=1 Tax=Streptomyces sp. NPDC014864 TaxID=3364924 RepID=UPI003700E2E5
MTLELSADLFAASGDPLDEALSRLRAGAALGAGDLALLTMAARTAQRAFEEIDRANTVLDDAAEFGEDIVGGLEDSLNRRARQEIPALLGALRAQAARVERSEAVRTVANRILGNDGGDGTEGGLAPVPVLTADLLPGVPSVYDDREKPGNSLADLWEREEQLSPVRHRVLRQRVQRVAAHLVSLADEIVDRSFSDTRFTRAALDEMDRAYALWCACLDER